MTIKSQGAKGKKVDTSKDRDKIIDMQDDNHIKEILSNPDKDMKKIIPTLLWKELG